MAAVSYLLFALMSISLRYWLSQLHLKLIAAQRHLLVVVNQRKEGVEHQVVSQVKLGAACLLTRVDTTVLNPARTPGAQIGKNEKKYMFFFSFIYRSLRQQCASFLTKNATFLVNIE